MERAARRRGSTSLESRQPSKFKKGEEMIRRRFLGLMTLTGLSGVAALSAKSFAEKSTVAYRVQGFTCVTCATGLETLLQRERGILCVKASYPAGLATITYDAKSITQADILNAIESMGFKAQIDTAGRG